jgi:hypothetical protein
MGANIGVWKALSLCEFDAYAFSHVEDIVEGIAEDMWKALSLCEFGA